jgi:hypothetical protein
MFSKYKKIAEVIAPKIVDVDDKKFQFLYVKKTFPNLSDVEINIVLTQISSMSMLDWNDEGR